MDYKEALNVAKEADKTLLTQDFNPYGLVEIIHEEGTILNFKNAFLKEWKNYVIVFTEHHGTHVYHKSDLYSYGYYIRQEIGKLKNSGHNDTCNFCNKEFKVEDLEYGHHPDIDQYDENEFYVYCSECEASFDISPEIE